MVYFSTQKSILGKFWSALEWKRLVYSIAVYVEYITAISECYGHLVFCNNLEYLSPVLVHIFCQEKSGNPVM
jgi:hypothetical protein